MKYHEGQKVVISNPEEGYERYKGEIITLDSFSWTNAWYCKENNERWIESELSPLEKTWETLQAGDIVIDDYGDGDSAKVLARINDLVALSFYPNVNTYSDWFTIEDLIQDGYTIKQGEPEDCPICAGSGKDDESEHEFRSKCKACNGSGNKEETIEILGKRYKKDDVVKKLEGIKEI